MNRSDPLWDLDGPEYEKPEEDVIIKTDSLVCIDGRWFKWNGQRWTQSEINPRTGKWRSVPGTAEDLAERMRRLNKIAAEDAKRLFEALAGRPSNLRGIKQ